MEGAKGPMTVVNAPTSGWAPAHVAALADQAPHAIPRIVASDVHAAIAGLDLWDSWPVQLADGRLALFDGAELWMMLAAPIFDDPDTRHGHARIRLLSYRDGTWTDWGNLLPDGFGPGNREWSGSSLYDPASGKLTLFFTAAGRQGGPAQSVEQRLFQTTGDLSFADGQATVANWTPPHESIVSDGDHYVIVNQMAGGAPGTIKAFRDPAFFRDPRDGADYLLFTGSLGRSDHAFNGTIGIARSRGAGHSDWQLLPPLLHADGLNNELERPHVLFRDGLYYLFWSTQRHVFNPDGPTGPTGLYGMVADELFGPWRPLNGTGLVAANPEAEPRQAYSWWVLDTLEVVSFVDHWGLSGREFEAHPELKRAQFGGIPAPRFRIRLDGDRAEVA